VESVEKYNACCGLERTELLAAIGANQ